MWRSDSGWMPGSATMCCKLVTRLPGRTGGEGTDVSRVDMMSTSLNNYVELTSLLGFAMRNSTYGNALFKGGNLWKLVPSPPVKWLSLQRGGGDPGERQ